jgi:CRP/FNR family transcriptional regulator, dissimilatory nitrate respiration regulator
MLARADHFPRVVAGRRNFLIARGRVRVVRAAADGREQVLHEEGSGATLAEAPAFDGGGYVGTAIASENTTVVLVPRAPF